MVIIPHYQRCVSLSKDLSKTRYKTTWSTSGEIRTPIDGFGDHNSTIELHPYFKELLVALRDIETLT